MKEQLTILKSKFSENGDNSKHGFIWDNKKQNGVEEITITDYSPLTLAYIGDGIYEIIIRTVIVDEANRQVNKIHKAASNLVKAQTQAEMIHLIMDDLTEEEVKIYKRGRNAKAITRAKNTELQQVLRH